jgi:hypothetical protein
VAAAGPVLDEVGLFGMFEDPAALIRVGPDNAGFLRWAYLAGMFGFYLLLTPVILALRRELAPPGRRAHLDLGMAGGLAYVLLGAAGAAILATISPPLVEAFAAGDPAEQAAALSTFSAFTEAVQLGLWQTLGLIPLTAWLVITGRALRRAGTPALGVAAMVLGVLAAVAWGAQVLDFEPLIGALVDLLIVLPVWVLLVGLRLLRQEAFVR